MSAPTLSPPHAESVGVVELMEAAGITYRQAEYWSNELAFEHWRVLPDDSERAKVMASVLHAAAGAMRAATRGEATS